MGVGGYRHWPFHERNCWHCSITSQRCATDIAGALWGVVCASQTNDVPFWQWERICCESVHRCTEWTGYFHFSFSSRMSVGEWVPRIILWKIQNWSGRSKSFSLIGWAGCRNIQNHLDIQQHPYSLCIKNAAQSVCAALWNSSVSSLKDSESVSKEMGPWHLRIPYWCGEKDSNLRSPFGRWIYSPLQLSTLPSPHD